MFNLSQMPIHPRKGQPAGQIEVTYPDGSKGELALEFLARLGGGRAAEVYLVRDNRTGKLYAEKVFKTQQGLSTSARGLVYRIFFQAPPPYEARESAVRASLFRRKVLRDLTELWFGRPLVADAYYTRWHEEEKAFVLGTEYIEGRGPRPGPINRRFFRRLLHNYPTRFFKTITRSKFSREKNSNWEIDEAVAQLDRFKDKFHQAGFTGSEWQVDKTLSVPTSNLRRDASNEWILIDVESAFPALIRPHYLWQALKIGSVPLFDDVDFTTLHKYVDGNRVELVDRLGEDRVQTLNGYVEQLEYFTRAWKESEPAIFSHRHRLITAPLLRAKIRQGLIDYWQITGRISAEKAEHLKTSRLRFFGYASWDFARELCSLPLSIPGSLKKLGQRLIQTVTWSLRLFYYALFSENRLREETERFVNQNIDDWQNSGRLTEAEVAQLRKDVQSPSSAEYLKGFLVQLGLQALEPPVIGYAAVVWLAVYLGSPEILAAIFISPLLRTGYTLYRKLKNRKTGISYRYAFWVGVLPHVGIMAYPAQMSSANPDLSIFLARFQASRFGSHVPLFGGTDSRLEHLCIKAINVLASLQYELGNLTGAIGKSLHLNKGNS